MPIQRLHDLRVCDDTWGIQVFYHHTQNDPKSPYELRIYLLKDIGDMTSGAQHVDLYKTELSALMDGCDYVSKHQHAKK